MPLAPPPRSVRWTAWKVPGKPGPAAQSAHARGGRVHGWDRLLLRCPRGARPLAPGCSVLGRGAPGPVLQARLCCGPRAGENARVSAPPVCQKLGAGAGVEGGAADSGNGLD